MNTLNYQTPMTVRPTKARLGNATARMVILILLLVVLTPAMLLPIVGAVLLLLNSAGAELLACWFYLPVVFLLVLVVSGVMRWMRRRRSMMVLSYLEQAMRLNLPLPRMLRAAAASESGAVQRRLLDLCEALEAGLPVCESVQREVLEVPPRAVDLIGVGESVGQLPRALSRLMVEERRAREDQGSDAVLSMVYPAVMIMGVSLVGSMLLIFVLPKFERIFRDFGLTMPSIVRWLQYGFVAVAPYIVILIVLFVTGHVMARLWEMLLPGRGEFLQKWCGALLDAAPGTRLGRNRALGDIFEVMAESVQAGYPFDRALQEAWALRLHGGMRRRVERWAEGVREGSPPAAAARTAGLPRLAVGLIASAQLTGNLAPALRFLSQYYSDRYRRAVIFLRAATVPALTLFFGAIVCVVALSIFVPMIRLIDCVLPMGRPL